MKGWRVQSHSTMKLWLALFTVAVNAGTTNQWDMPHAGNPILPGYYADPTVLAEGGKHYVYATLEPWGGTMLGCWESSDFKNWTYRVLNWPTKQACTSPTSKQANVWAPSVVRGVDGRFHMFISVGSEIWTGVADHPLGPFKEGGTSPILVTDRERNVVSPGHHGFFREAERDYIVYHRHRVPFVEDSAFRQVCVDELHFTTDGWIEKVAPTHRGPVLVQGRTAGRGNLADLGRGARANAASSSSELTRPERVLDDNYATRWEPKREARASWLQLDLGAEQTVAGADLERDLPSGQDHRGTRPFQ